MNLIAVFTKLDELTSRLSTKNRIILTSGNSFNRPEGAPFFIYLPSGGGSVTYVTEGGQTNTETLLEGYHPTAFTKIVTSAVNLTICF